MGIKALKLDEVERFVSRHDEFYGSEGEDADGNPVHGEGATVWLIGTLTSLQASILADDMASFGQEGGMVLRNADNDVLAARMALRGFGNFEGPEFKSKTEVVRKSRMEMMTPDVAEVIPLVVLREIGQRAKAGNKLTKEEAKN